MLQWQALFPEGSRGHQEHPQCIGRNAHSEAPCWRLCTRILTIICWSIAISVILDFFFFFIDFQRASLLSHVQLFVTPWTIAHQIPLAMGFSRQEYWSWLPFPSPRDLPDPGIKPTSPASPALKGTTWEGQEWVSGETQDDVNPGLYGAPSPRWCLITLYQSGEGTQSHPFGFKSQSHHPVAGRLSNTLKLYHTWSTHTQSARRGGHREFRIQ